MRISQPDPRRPANASGTWPHDAPKPVPGHADPGNGTLASDDQPYEERHQADAVPDDSGGWSLPQKYVPPPDWHGEDTYVPRNDDGPAPMGWLIQADAMRAAGVSAEAAVSRTPDGSGRAAPRCYRRGRVRARQRHPRVAGR